MYCSNPHEFCCICYIYKIFLYFSENTFEIWKSYDDGNESAKKLWIIMFTVVVMMVLIIIMLLKYKKSKKIIAILAIGTLAAFFGIFQMYLYNVDQIVSVIEEEEGNAIFISYWGGNNLEVDEATQKKIFELCEGLKPLPEAEQLKLRGELDDNGDYIEDTILLWSSYPEKWGHNFDLMVNVYEDKIFIDKGDDHKQQMIVTFYEDNGLLELVNEVKEKQ